MKLITKEIKNKLAKNVGDANVDKPWLKLFNPAGIGTWLITEYDEDTGLMFGLCDLGYPELGYVNLKEVEDLDLPFGMKIERDAWWNPEKTLIEYYNDARGAA
jgi:hypothetical protein|tara:strand:+ start:50 stop:358 length:309 start_codon:yes stop_codon:yes gene_type:complete